MVTASSARTITNKASAVGGKRKFVDHDPVASSSSDGDAPMMTKRMKRTKKPTTAKKRKIGEDADGGGGDIRRHLKPLFEVEDRVYAAWWPDKRSQRLNRDPTWHPGVIKGYAVDARKRKSGPSPYGPTRFYDILYDDGDELEGVADHYIFPRVDYLLSMKNDGGSNWVGVRNETDDMVDDKWARIVGWYVATIDGEERPFTYLSDAMDAYDKWATGRWAREGTLREGRRPCDLNRPELYSHLFEEEESVSDGAGGGEGEGGSLGENHQDDTDFQFLERNGSAMPSPPTIWEESSSPDENRNRGAAASPSPRKRRKIPHSAYGGVSYSKQDRKHLAQINYDGKVHCLGYYKFEADAALATDKSSMLGSSRERIGNNFSTRKEYEDAIRTEMESCGCHLVNVEESYDAVVEKVGAYLSKIYAARDDVADAEPRGGRNDDNAEAAGNAVADVEMGNNEESNNNPNGGEDMDVSSGSQNIITGGRKLNNDEAARSPKKEGKYYDYIGYSKAGDKYRSYVYMDSKCQWLGTYKLEVDAAFAHDEAVRELKMPEEKANFATSDDYEEARLKELRRTGRGVDNAMSSTAIASKVREIVAKARPNSTNATSLNHGNQNPGRKTREDSNAPAASTSDKSKKEEERHPSGPSDYAGVSYHKNHCNWVSYVLHGKRKITLGSYKLEAVAAYARDEGARLLRKTEEGNNFASIREYEDAKLRELETTSLGLEDAMMSPAAIAAKVAKIISKAILNLANLASPKGNGEAAETASREPNGSIPPRKAPLGESNIQQKHSKFTGVTLHKRNGTYTAQIGHSGKTHFLGYYKLQSDAAIAYDEAAKLLRGADSSKVNFSSGRRDYADARTNELKELEKSGRGSGASVESLMDIAPKIRKYLSKIPCPEIVAMNDAMARKWARHLPTETGREYLVSYNKDIEDALRLTLKVRNASAPSIVSDKQDDGRADDAEVESVPDEPPDALVKPIGGGNADDLSGESGNENAVKSRSPQQYDQPKPVDESGGDVSLFGDTDENDAIHPKPVNESDNDVSLFGDTDKNDVIHPKPVEESDDNVSHFSENEENGAEESVAGETAALPDANSKVILPAPLSHDKNIIASPNRKKEFPIGCPVLWHFDCNSFCRGIVTSAPIHGADGGATYEVMPTKSQYSTVMPEKSLGYGVNCPVYVSHGSESNLLKGKILFCKTCNSEAESFSYTIIIKKEGNQFQVMNDVPPEHVKYRDVMEAEAIVPTIKSIALADAGSVAIDDACSVAINGEVPPQAKKNSTAVLASAAEEVGSPTSSQKFFSSNSTITSVDSAMASSQRVAVGGTRCHDRDSSVEVAVYVPHWLVHDGETKQRLISHLLRVDKRISNYQCLQRIGRKTHCTLRIVERGDFHVLIQTRPGKYATEDIRKAGETLENVLLEHIHHDGSAGRLFYDLARSCEFLHPKGSAQSTSVMQRNPFTKNNEMGWMNIMEIPYTREAGNRKRYHGHCLIAKKSSVLGRIKHETRCEIKLCGDEFKVPTELCVPYIWIMGDQPGLVDRAVGILQEAIRNHMRECRCAL